MKRIFAFFTLLFLVITIYNAISYAPKLHWEAADAVITFIGLPDGDVFIDFTDQRGEEHKQAPLGWIRLAPGYKLAEAEKHYGEKIRILYDPVNGRSIPYNTVISGIAVPACLLLFFFTAMIVSIIKSKKNG